MTEFAEQSRENTVYAAELGELIVDRFIEARKVATFFEEALPIVEDLEKVNSILDETGRSDLIITEPVQVLPVHHPSDIPEHCSNFTPNFFMPIGSRETGDLDTFTQKPKTQPIPPTSQDILTLKDVPAYEDFDQIAEFRESGKFPPLNVHIDTHATKSAFVRMLILFPEFTTDLTVAMSQPENRSAYNYSKYEDRLYVAYHLMSRLVDSSDKHVLKDDGSINEWYLRG